MKIRILEDVKTDLAEEAILSVLPEEIDPIGISEIKVENYLVRYFYHKGEIVVTEVKLLPEEVETNSNKRKNNCSIRFYGGLNIFQKAVKIRKICEINDGCTKCPYADNCIDSDIVFFAPVHEDLKTIAEAIILEKWDVK